MYVTSLLLERDLLYVTGKGGAGKTTVAAALALAASARGRRAVVCEIAGAHHLADLGSLAIDPHQTLLEWIRAQPGGAIGAAILGHSAGFMRFVAAAPGAKEMVVIGKAVDLAQSGDRGLVIVDGPSTGHALAMLSAPRTIGAVARAGPVGSQARDVHRFLADAARTGYVGVALPEEMPLHELVELEDGLHDAIGRGLDLIVIDGVYPDRFTDAEVARLREVADHGLVTAALSEHRVARDHAARVRRLRDQVTAPIVTLPFVFAAELGAAEYELLAARLLDLVPPPREVRGESAAAMRAGTDVGAPRPAA